MANPSPPDRASGTSRLAWADQLRTLVIVLVVNLHACVTYSHIGSWYVQETPEPPLGARIAFLFWEAHLQAFFMGILFLLAGYFAHGSMVHRGPAGSGPPGPVPAAHAQPQKPQRRAPQPRTPPRTRGQSISSRP